MSDTPTPAALLSVERLAEIRKPYDKSLLDEASWHEISYRTISTNPEALSGAAKLVALDRQDLWQHIDAQRHFEAKRNYATQQAHDAYRQQVAEALKSLLVPEPTEAEIWHPSPEYSAVAGTKKAQNAQVRRAAASLGIDLTA